MPPHPIFYRRELGRELRRELGVNWRELWKPMPQAPHGALANPSLSAGYGGPRDFTRPDPPRHGTRRRPTPPRARSSRRRSSIRLPLPSPSSPPAPPRPPPLPPGCMHRAQRPLLTTVEGKCLHHFGCTANSSRWLPPRAPDLNIESCRTKVVSSLCACSLSILRLGARGRHLLN